MNIYEKLQKCRVELQSKNLKKSGLNKFAGFTYYDLSDFLPVVNQLFQENKLFSLFIVGVDKATLTIINSEKPDELLVFETPIADASIKGCTPIQCLGGVHTYLKRYLYQNALEIVESEYLDNIMGEDEHIKEKLDDELLNTVAALNIDLSKLAIYLKKDISDLTNDDLREAAAQKEKALTVKKQK